MFSKDPEKVTPVQHYRSFIHCLSILAAAALLSWSGCAGKASQPVPEDDIRSRSDRAFDDLQAQEQGRPAEPDSARTPPPSAPPAPGSTVAEEAVPIDTGGTPAWIDGQSRQFPPGRYLTGVGYGNERPAAEDKARAEIAKIFTSHIDSSNRTYQEIFESRTGGKSRSAESINFEEITRVSTQKVLSGVRIGRVYRDPSASPEYYALAVLDRIQAAEILRSRIVELDRQIEQLLSDSRNQTDKLTRIKLMRSCIEQHALRQAYNAELRIVERSGRGIPPPVNIAEIKTQFAGALLKDFLIALSVQGSRADEVRRALVEALNSKGFSVSEQISSASVLARGRVEIKPIPQSDADWKFVRWSAYFDLVDQNGGAVFGSVHKSGKSGHLTTAQAEDRAVRSIRQSLAAEISEDLSNYILRQSR
ncbi:MAG: hypothetical protein AMJ54_01600 [Deltaproteobacteria bacterium SG8_13]|nr:MAG: hypothetical protein AMJ54_01600 [Deltaproteobacteria bacterium SG8_13]